MIKRYIIPACFLAALIAIGVNAGRAKENNIIDEVAWVVGDEPIFKSEIEEMYEQMQMEGAPIEGDPYCVIPERMAVEKLYLHQAKIDTIEAPDQMVQQSVDQRLNFFISQLGSKERVEDQFKKTMPQIRETLVEMYRNNYIISQVQSELTKNVKPTPADVRKFYNALPEDSIPYVPLRVEAQIITINPNIPQQEIDDVKARLRDFTEKVQSGESDFGTLAFFYSEDRGSAMQSGELGFHNRADFVPEFSNVAFNLNDPKKVSRIVETEYGYHIIQLIEKRGEQINCRHILLRPKVARADIDTALVRLDSLRNDILKGALDFETAAQFISQDKDTHNNKGIMMNSSTGSVQFEMQELPAEVARRIEAMEPGDISEPFAMMDERKNKEVVSLVKLTKRIPGHKANLAEDYNQLKEMYTASAKEEILKKWLEKKIKETYVQIGEGWDDGCEFEYSGWRKN